VLFLFRPTRPSDAKAFLSRVDLVTSDRCVHELIILLAIAFGDSIVARSKFEE
jgi:hypothetical protein